MSSALGYPKRHTERQCAWGAVFFTLMGCDTRDTRSTWDTPVTRDTHKPERGAAGGGDTRRYAPATRDTRDTPHTLRRARYVRYVRYARYVTTVHLSVIS